jgi:exodeoxyribonuclease V gamma subunit
MGFYLYTGNKLEVLAEKVLCNSLLSTPLSDPLKKEKIIVQNQGMAAWLKMQIAKYRPICANIEFPFLNSLINEILSITLPQDKQPNNEYFHPDALTWRLFELLADKKNNYPELASYIKGTNVELKQYQLAERIAYSFDQYEIFRPDLLIQWEKSIVQNRENGWQAELWKELTLHHISRSRGFLNFFESADVSKLDYKRIFIFGITTMPALYLDFFQQLGNSTSLDIHFFYLTPCSENWKYTFSNREEANIVRKLAANNTYNEEFFIDKGNPLLGSFGRVGREFFSTMLEITDYNDDDHFIEPSTNTMLGQIQYNILTNTPTDYCIKHTLNKNDKSIQIHNCHNQTREIEILYDNILDIIRTDSTMQPRNIIVITPDISTYAPFIKSVFDRKNFEINKNQITLPYSLSDVKVAKNSKIVNTFFNILGLKNSKFKISEILDILETEAVRSAFDIEDRELDYIRKWIKESGMRWGINAEHRSELKLPEFSENSIEDGIKRLMLGFAMDDNNSVYQNCIIPYDNIEIPNAELLGKLSSFLQSLFKLRKTLSGINTIETWNKQLNEIMDFYFINNNETFRDISLLRKAFNNLERTALTADFNKPVSLDIIKNYLQKTIDTESINEGFLRGKITFSTMLPMRSIPAKTICMIGMNDGVFPRQERKLGFNIIDKDIRICDRSKRFEDRYIFLEAMLAAENILYISYIGQNDKSNDCSPPAAPICELTDHITQLFGNSVLDHIITVHKLQAFNRLYYQKKRPKLFSYSKTDCNAAKTLTKKQIKRLMFKKSDTHISKEIRNITLDELIYFFRNPCKTLLAKTMNISIYTDDVLIPPDTEPLELDGLENYSINQDIINSLIDDIAKDDLYLRLKLTGRLPIGHEGVNVFNKIYGNVSELFNKPKKGFMSPCDSLKNTTGKDFKLNIDGTVLTGTLNNISPDKYQVYFQVAGKNGKRILEAWLRHLIFTASGLGDTTFSFIGKDSSKFYAEQYSGYSKEEAENILTGIIKIYKEGLASPLPFFPNTSYTYATAKKKKQSTTKKIFVGDKYNSGEIENPYINMCFDENILNTDEFDYYARTLFSKYWVDENIE